MTNILSNESGCANLRPYQQQAATRTLQRLLSHSGHLLCLDPGLGKTAVTANVITSLVNFTGVDRVLITAPPRVLSHWPKELARFGDQSLPVISLTGTQTQRREQLKKHPTGIFLISHNLLAWLVHHVKPTPFDMFVIDESSKVRNWMTKLSRAARKVARTSRFRLLLTGSPAPNTPNELYPQIFLVDPETPLGKNVTDYRQRFTYAGGFNMRQHVFMPHLLPLVQEITDPWITRQSNTILTGFPKTVINTIPVTLPPMATRVYKQIEQELHTALTVDPLFVESSYLMCRQMASGSYYDNARKPTFLHAAKLDALTELVDEIDDRVVVAYQFVHELAALQRTFPKAITVDRLDEFADHKMLLAQSQSISHGVDGLQHLSHTIVFYTLPDSPEVFEQFIARLARSGQASPSVIVHILSAIKTVDRLVQTRLERKIDLQAALLEYFE